MASTPGAVIRFTTTPEGAEKFASVLERLLEHVNAEAGTTTWIGARSDDDPTRFFIADLFADEDARTVHFTGEAAKLLRAEAPGLLAGDPEIARVSLLAGKNV
jgi:quinol monooxygenase YgiN